MPDLLNRPLLTVLAGRKRRPRARASGAVIEVNPGRPIVVQVCTDFRLRVGREVVATLIGVPESELEVMPPLMGVADVRLLLNCIRISPETMPAARLLSALQGELQRAQGMVNLSGSPLRDAIGAATDGAVLRQQALASDGSTKRGRPRVS